MKVFWEKFCRWRGWKACADGWKTVIRWKGWGQIVRWEGWKAFAQWKCWHLHPVLSLLLAVISGGLVLWIFLAGREETVIAYPIYCLAAYALTVLVVAVPKTVKWVSRTAHTNPMIKPLVEDKNKRFLLDLFREQIVNFLYGGFKVVSGFLIGSWWTWADGLYNFVQGIIQLLQLALHRKHLPLEKQWKSYRICGFLVLILHLTMTGLVFMMIHQDQAEEYPGFMIFAIAAFSFYKLITSFVNVAKDRKHISPVDSSVYLLDLTQAMFSLFSLQVALIHAFDDGTLNVKLMNTMTGSIVCMLVLGTGIYMIRRATRELKNM